jgi:hypothetical protein
MYNTNYEIPHYAIFSILTDFLSNILWHVC